MLKIYIKLYVDCDLFLYADDSCLVYQHNHVEEIERNLSKNFSNVYDWFVDDKLNIPFGEAKTKCILFSIKHRLIKVVSLDVSYGELHIKQHHIGTYLRCSLNETLFLESQWL